MTSSINPNGITPSLRASLMRTAALLLPLLAGCCSTGQMAPTVERGPASVVEQAPVTGIERVPVREQAPVREQGPVGERVPVGERAPVRVVERPIFNEQRLALTREYAKTHYGSSTYLLETPRMIVVHYTAFPTLDESYRFFAPALLSRKDIRRGGAVNVSAHFLVDKDGTVYRLAPDNVICRHTIGFNQVALGIENVGEGQHALTDAELEADAALIAELVARYPSIRYLLGHYEYRDRTLPHFALHSELDPSYRPTYKIDPGKEFMTRLRQILEKRYRLKLER